MCCSGSDAGDIFILTTTNDTTVCKQRIRKIILAMWDLDFKCRSVFLRKTVRIYIGFLLSSVSFSTTSADAISSEAVFNQKASSHP